MAGIYPDGGVPPAQTTNAVTVDTSCAAELFYSVNRCNPRFEPAAMNALMSEVLNVVSNAGIEYNCDVLTNLYEAISALTGAREAQVGMAVYPGGFIYSALGDLLWNCTDNSITVSGSLETNPLVGIGFCRLAAEPIAATVSAVDSFGNVYEIGDQIIRFPSGTVLAVNQGGGGAVTAPDASETAKGVVEIATNGQIRNGTQDGETGAKLVMTAYNMKRAAVYTGEIDANNDRLWMYDDSAGQMMWVAVSAVVGEGSGGSNNYTPITLNGGSGTWPDHPEEADGYWVVTDITPPTNGSYSLGTPNASGGYDPGTAYDLTATGSGEDDGVVEGYWYYT